MILKRPPRSAARSAQKTRFDASCARSLMSSPKVSGRGDPFGDAGPRRGPEAAGRIASTTSCQDQPAYCISNATARADAAGEDLRRLRRRRTSTAEKLLRSPLAPSASWASCSIGRRDRLVMGCHAGWCKSSTKLPQAACRHHGSVTSRASVVRGRASRPTTSEEPLAMDYISDRWRVMVPSRQLARAHCSVGSTYFQVNADSCGGPCASNRCGPRR